MACELRHLLPVSAVMLAAIACGGTRDERRQSSDTTAALAAPSRPPTPPNDSGSPAEPAAGVGAEWPMATGDYANTRFSTLDQITAANAGKLGVAWTFATGVLRGQEAAPLVVGGTMYVVTPYPNVLYALDLTKPGAPAKWAYRPKPSSAAQGVACCDVVNRGAAYADGKIFYNTLDNHTVAVAWRAYSTGPDANVLIGDRYRPFYAAERGRDLGVRS